jgi:N-acyl-D-amino-acid deacylase
MTKTILIRNGRVHDGARFLGVCDVLIEDGRVAGVGQLSDIHRADVGEVLDATGLVVCPGFIELHNMTYQVEQLDGNDALNLIAQGVTTCLTGNCGQSGEIRSLDEFLGRFEFLRNARLGINVGVMVGHNSLRRYVLQDASRPATNDEVDEMCQFVERAIGSGALGFSTGLMYDPGAFATAEELERIVAVVGAHDKLYATHLRDEGDRLCEAVVEALDTARAGNARLVISHLKAAGASNWGKTGDALSVIEQRRDRQEVYVTYYPYDATSTALRIVILPEILRAANGDLAEIKYSKEDEELIRRKGLQNLCLRCWDDVAIVSSRRKELIGHSIRTISRSQPAYRTVLEILRDDPDTRVVFHNIASEQEILDIARLPYALVVSDGYVYATGACDATHPRNYGSFARMVKHFSQTDLEGFIHRATQVAARVLRLAKRGRLEAGCFADVAVFQPCEVTDRADYRRPFELSEGVSYTIVNGQIAFRKGKSTGQFAGALVQ